MQQLLYILGRQPALGLAELESLYGAAAITPVGDHATLVTPSTEPVAFSRLGGSIKCCTVLNIIDGHQWPKLQRALTSTAIEHSRTLPEGKLLLGLSAYDLPISPHQLEAAGLTIKKAIRASGRSVRLVPNKEPALNSAQVLHNKLTTGNGGEFVLIRHATQTIIAKTSDVQDINSYTRRDRERPQRDARVGMLPPKLAQIIINLAVTSVDPHHGGVILDPFCGTGVVLQEATLMGFDIYGSDLEPRMVEYSDKNLLWLLDQPENHITAHSEDGRYYHLEQGDATTHQWQPLPHFVAGETYLGRPFTAKPSAEILEQTVSEVSLILKKFLKNIHTQLKPGARLCLAVPAWQTAPNTFRHLPLIDQIEDLGYTRVSFEHVRDDQLVYYRQDQIVARQLLILTRH